MARAFDRTLIPAAPDLAFEAAQWAGGTAAVAGLDEAGRGAWAGPVSAAAVIFPQDHNLPLRLPGIRDSKMMSPISRDCWAEQIRQAAAACAVGLASNLEIDALGIVAATRLAMARALAGLPLPPEHLLIDALLLPDTALPQTALIKGDARSLSIAAASILAKTARDSILVALDGTYPGYGFARHKGYGTAAHRRALLEHGPCPAHRFSFAPLAGRELRCAEAASR